MRFKFGDGVRGKFVRQDNDEYDYKYGTITEVRNQNSGVYYVIDNWFDVIFAEKNIEYAIVVDSPLWKALS